MKLSEQLSNLSVHVKSAEDTVAAAQKEAQDKIAAVATNVPAALTGSASGGLTIALDRLGEAYMTIAAQTGISPALMHRVTVIGAGTLDILPHDGAVVSLLAICGSTHRENYLDIVMVAIVGAVLALVAMILLGTVFGSF